MPDNWEEKFHGLNPLVNDANLDLDGDGCSNLKEYQAGTDPSNPDDIPSPVIQVTPNSLSFGYVPIGSSKDMTLAVKNTGGGTLSGTATTDVPFIVYGGSYSLGPDQSKNVTIRYQPTSKGLHTGTVIFTGGEGFTVQITGNNYIIGDINNDGGVTISDAILAIQVFSGIIPTSAINIVADVDGDDKIGMAEVIYILQKVAGLR